MANDATWASTLTAGTRLHAEADGDWYHAEVLEVSPSKKRSKAPVKVQFYDGSVAWCGRESLRSKKIKDVISTPGHNDVTQAVTALVIGAAVGDPKKHKLKPLRLRDIRYTQASYRNVFGNGKRLEETIEDLRQGRAKFGTQEDVDLPRIKVVDFHGYWLSLDNRRLRCLQAVLRPDEIVHVIEKSLSDPIVLKEFNSKFSTGMVAFPTEPGSHGIRDAEAASKFIAGLCTKEELEAARAACRESYEQKMEQLVRERDQHMNLFDDYQRQHEQPDAAVSEAVVVALETVGSSDVRGMYKLLSNPPSLNQLQRVLAHLVDSGTLVSTTRSSTETTYAHPDAPRAHSNIIVQKQGDTWTLVSSMAFRQHALFDGRSLAVQHAYVGCSLSSSCVGPSARAIIQLSGKWGKGDKLFIGCWPRNTDTDLCFCAPGRASQANASLQGAPGYWISCSSGYFSCSRSGLVAGPEAWSVPAKAEGVRWGIHLKASGGLELACAAPGEELCFKERKWSRQHDFVDEISDLALAVLLQPHQRSDASQACLIIESVGLFNS